MRVKSKETAQENIKNNLEVINWLLNAGAITPADARDMRKYVEGMA
jgi:hypothetical protein